MGFTYLLPHGRIVTKRISFFVHCSSSSHTFLLPCSKGEGEVQERGDIENKEGGEFGLDYLDYYEGDFAQRKPMVGERCSGEAPPRVAARSMWGLLFQEPPRTLLYRPAVGPGGLRSGMTA